MSCRETPAYAAELLALEVAELTVASVFVELDVPDDDVELVEFAAAFSLACWRSWIRLFWLVILETDKDIGAPPGGI